MQENNSNYKVVFSPQSLLDIKEINNYISKNLSNPDSAKKITRRLFDDCDNLKINHSAGIKVSKYTKYPNDFKFVLSGNYSIFYYISQQNINIVRVLYSKCDFISRLFTKKWNFSNKIYRF